MEVITVYLDENLEKLQARVSYALVVSFIITKGQWIFLELDYWNFELLFYS